LAHIFKNDFYFWFFWPVHVLKNRCRLSLKYLKKVFKNMLFFAQLFLKLSFQKLF
jgi:hypothetical protein